VSAQFSPNDLGALLGQALVPATRALSIVGLVSLALILVSRWQAAQGLAWLSWPGDRVPKRVTALPGVKLRVKGSTITELFVTSVAIWNRESQPIRGANDVPTAERLKVEVGPHGRILNAEVTASTALANRVVLEVASPAAVIANFEYLDPRDGFVVRLIHTGSTAVAVSGRVIGRGPARFTLPRSRIALIYLMWVALHGKRGADVRLLRERIGLVTLAVTTSTFPFVFPGFFATGDWIAWAAFLSWVLTSAFALYGCVRDWSPTLPAALAPLVNWSD